jgi:phosphatidate cytidylyltransferase
VNLLRRVTSGLLAGSGLFAVLYLAARNDLHWIAGVLILVVAYLAALEYLALMKRLDIQLAAPEFLIWIPILAFSFMLFDGVYADVVLLFAISYQVLRYLGDQPHKDGFIRAIAGVFGLLYIPWLLHYFYLIYVDGASPLPQVGAVQALTVLLMVWGYDSGAYFVGSLIGRHKAFPSISPHKTWEGVAGGFVFTLIGALIGAALSADWRAFVFWSGFPHVVASSFLIGWATQLGDVFASKLKRAAGVKDSGTFLPGHGGVLDRIDGLLFALPVFYFYYHFVVRFI